MTLKFHKKVTITYNLNINRRVTKKVNLNRIFIIYHVVFLNGRYSSKVK